MVTFAGEIADYYASFRRGFAPPALEFVVDQVEASPDELVVDLGCGTGQLAVPLSSRVRHVLGVDPEPDMLAHARATARRQGASGATSWLLGSDGEVPSLAGLLGESAVDLMTISNAVHFMDTKRLFAGLAGVLAPGGRVAVIANGTPIWLQESHWSGALRRFLQQRFNSDLSGSCYTDDATLARCRGDLEAAGFTTAECTMNVHEAVSADWLFGNLMSAMPPDWLPGQSSRTAFAAELTKALRSGQATGDFVDEVPVSIVVGRH